MKKLPHLPHLPRSKLSRKRSSFGARGSLAILNLPRICRTCRICPTLGRFGIFGDQLETRQYPVSVGLVHFDSEDVPDGVVEAVGADGVEAVECAAVLSCSMELESGLLSMVHAPSGWGWVGRVNRCTEQIIAAGS